LANKEFKQNAGEGLTKRAVDLKLAADGMVRICKSVSQASITDADGLVQQLEALKDQQGIDLPKQYWLQAAKFVAANNVKYNEFALFVENLDAESKLVAQLKSVGFDDVENFVGGVVEQLTLRLLRCVSMSDAVAGSRAASTARYMEFVAACKDFSYASVKEDAAAVHNILNPAEVTIQELVGSLEKLQAESPRPLLQNLRNWPAGKKLYELSMVVLEARYEEKAIMDTILDFDGACAKAFDTLVAQAALTPDETHALLKPVYEKSKAIRKLTADDVEQAESLRTAAQASIATYEQRLKDELVSPHVSGWQSELNEWATSIPEVGDPSPFTSTCSAVMFVAVVPTALRKPVIAAKEVLDAVSLATTMLFAEGEQERLPKQYLDAKVAVQDRMKKLVELGCDFKVPAAVTDILNCCTKEKLKQYYNTVRGHTKKVVTEVLECNEEAGSCSTSFRRWCITQSVAHVLHESSLVFGQW
jgi:beta-phosphoglucomutase-like phosphatase (HAD superfamily)